MESQSGDISEQITTMLERKETAVAQVREALKLLENIVDERLLSIKITDGEKGEVVKEKQILDQIEDNIERFEELTGIQRRGDIR